MVQQTDQSLANLRERFAWPDEKPDVPPSDHGWFAGRPEVFRQFAGPDARVYLELGSWMGKSARWFARECPNATIICVDHWQGSPEHLRKPKWKQHLATLYETFLTNMWDLRDRVIPIRTDTLTGMTIVAEAGVKPDLIYIDAGHDSESVYHDLRAALTLFPEAQIIGDDWPIEGVRDGVQRLLAERGEASSLAIDDPVWFLRRSPNSDGNPPVSGAVSIEGSSVVTGKT